MPNFTTTYTDSLKPFLLERNFGAQPTNNYYDRNELPPDAPDTLRAAIVTRELPGVRAVSHVVNVVPLTRGDNNPFNDLPLDVSLPPDYLVRTDIFVPQDVGRLAALYFCVGERRMQAIDEEQILREKAVTEIKRREVESCNTEDPDLDILERVSIHELIESKTPLTEWRNDTLEFCAEDETTGGYIGARLVPNDAHTFFSAETADEHFAARDRFGKLVFNALKVDATVRDEINFPTFLRFRESAHFEKVLRTIL